MSKFSDFTAAQLRAVENDCEAAYAAADEILRVGRGGNVALILFVLRGCAVAARAASNMLGDVAADMEAVEEAPARAARPEKQSGDHRHKFGPDGRCTVPGCERVKGAAGRKPAVELAPPADTRTAALPFEAGAADRFAGGGMGSSGRQVGR